MPKRMFVSPKDMSKTSKLFRCDRH